MLNSFSCHNFRNIEADDLKFGRINLLIGPNNSGKSNFIKALTFISEMLKCADEGGLNTAFLNAVKRNGRERMLNFAVQKDTPIKFSLKIDLFSEPAEFQFVAGADESSCVVSENLNSAKFSELREFLGGFSVFAGSQFSSAAIREPADTKSPDILLNKTASNFVNIFSRYKSESLKWKMDFIGYMKHLMPDISDLDSVVLYDRLIFKIKQGDYQYDLADASEGTIRGLVLNTIINMPMEQKCSLLAIDEPEIGLHPAWQKVVGNWIQSSGNFEQCFISTHSPDLLDTFTDGFKSGDAAVFVFDAGKTCCEIKKVAYENIASELGNWELGDLFRTCDPALGGWPW